MTRRWSLAAVGGFALFALQGCGDAYYPESLRYEFTPYTLKSSKLELDAAQAQETAEIVEKYFGTPRNPTVAGIGFGGKDEQRIKVKGQEIEDFAKLDAEKAKERKSAEQLQLSPETLAQGSKVYRQNCLYCHGINGDGGGPTGQFLNPRPRDFRLAIFKFYSTLPRDHKGDVMTGVSYPSRNDLQRTIREGIPTGNMPSFRANLTETELNQVTSYVIHLAFRGYVQLRVAEAIKDNKRNPGRFAEEALGEIARNWFYSSSDSVETEAPPDWFADFNNVEKRNERIAYGRTVFNNAGCAKCHGRDGSASREEIGNEGYDRINDWGEINPPRDLTMGQYRGGSRPLDIYYRIRVGIYPAEMPPKDHKDLSERDAWALVQYVMSLPEKKYPYTKQP